MFTFEDYMAALDGAGPRTRENILERAEKEGFTADQFKKLVNKAYNCLQLDDD